MNNMSKRVGCYNKRNKQYCNDKLFTSIPTQMYCLYANAS